jgi:DNA-binding CsgD family transcriptional regulator
MAGQSVAAGVVPAEISPRLEPTGSSCDDPTAPRSPPIVGRESELDAIARWLAASGPNLLEIEGEAGIGKTTLWIEATRRARAAGCLVLACQPAEANTDVAYGALATVLEPALVLVDGAVPVPRLQALEGALRIRDVPESRLDETAVALGLVSVLRALAAHRRVVVALDDVQWLDRSSRSVLTYALRNIAAADDVSVVTATRADVGCPRLDLAGSPLSAAGELLHPGPLSVGALHRAVMLRLGTALSRPKLVRLHAVTRGNPLHAIELARVIETAGAHDALSVPASLGDVLRARVAPLAPRTRRLLVAVAAAGDIGPAELTGLAGPDEIDEAVDHGILVLADGRVGFSHPLLASTVYADAGELLRSRVHRRLAQLSASPEERVRHLALGGSEPDESIAASLDRAADAACERGARSSGAALYEHAARLTPAGCDNARARRLILAADAHFESGEANRADQLLREVAAGESDARWEALCRLGTLADETVGGQASLAAFEAALGTTDPRLAARAHRGLAQSLIYVGDLERALGHANAAVAAASGLADHEPLAYALAMQGLVRSMLGTSSWREPLAHAVELEKTSEVRDLDGCPSAFAAEARRLTLELDEASAGYLRLQRKAAERGDIRTECWCRFGLAATAMACGRWTEAAEHERELGELAEQTGLFRLPALRTSAQLAALTGDADRARTLARVVVEQAEAANELHNLRSALAILGFVELSVGDAAAAARALCRARELVEQTAVGEPAMLVFLLDEVEALVGSGRVADAAFVVARFEERCVGHDAAWIEPLTLRAHGIVDAAGGDVEAARMTLERAVALEDDLPLPLERARTRLALGRVLRRQKRRTAAFELLASALAAFEALGAALWAEQARSEMARIGGRASSRDDLTRTEERIAGLVAEGMTNREVAAALFVTPKTVESSLTRVYRKLGVRSRTELARRIGRVG